MWGQLCKHLVIFITKQVTCTQKGILIEDQNEENGESLKSLNIQSYANKSDVNREWAK